MVMLELTWQYTCHSWFVRRYTWHSTVAVERFSRHNREKEAEVAKFKMGQLQSSVRETGRSPTDVDRLVALHHKIDDTASDLENILARKATEVDDNRALQTGGKFLKLLDELINSATRRRNDAFALLERYSEGLGRSVKEATDEILDAEFNEVDKDTKELSKAKTIVGPEDQLKKEETKDGPKVETEDEPEFSDAPSIIPIKDENTDDFEPQNRS
jgi:hypothetical protein